MFIYICIADYKSQFPNPKEKKKNALKYFFGKAFFRKVCFEF